MSVGSILRAGCIAIMKMEKSPQSLLDTFESVVPGAPAETRLMFGYKTGVVNGNLFMGLFADKMHLRLPEELRAELIAKGGEIFEPMAGRPMREYVVVPRTMLSKRAELSKWVNEALRYCESLPAKKKAVAKKKSAKKKTK
jgi:TfoX/Sxy family transcriptional regulator of competence genes